MGSGANAWALVDRGALDLRSNKLVAWPAGLAIPATAAAAVTGDGGLALVVPIRGGGAELVTVRAGKVARDPIAITPPAENAVGVVVDRSDRAVVAMRDGRLAIRERGAWTVVSVSEQLPDEHPGAGPAASPR